MAAVLHLMNQGQSPRRTQVPMALWLRVACPATNQGIDRRPASLFRPPHHLLDPRSAL